MQENKRDPQFQVTCSHVLESLLFYTFSHPHVQNLHGMMLLLPA